MRTSLICLFSFFLLFTTTLNAASERWEINKNGSISWFIKDSKPHNDHIEMSGKQVSTVLRYGVTESGAFQFNRGMVWPLLRTIPNDTHASLMRRMSWNVLNEITLNGYCLRDEKVSEISLNGMMTVKSSCPVSRNGKVEITRELFPSVALPAFLEQYTITNVGTIPVTVEVPVIKSTIQTDPAKGVSGSYRIETGVTDASTVILKPGEKKVFGAYTIAYQPNQRDITINIENEKQQRQALISQLQGNLVLETPDNVINTMFAFAKIRASESIYATQQGPMHGPGGESYYAAIWANDQAEYIGPFAPYLGYAYGNEAALNAYNHFARFMNPEYKPIPSSIVAEGLDFWNGVGDRGDAAMIAYGASRYALARANRAEAGQLWPLIEWCLEFSRRKVNAQGVVASDTDELENRFPAGKANLCTSTLYYDALISASYLGKELGKPVAQYTKQIKPLRAAIEKYFGAKVEGFDTYQYYEGNTKLRSWICMPLTVGIYDREKETIKALFSPSLWTKDGLLTQSGSETFWDRSTLYALRGVFAAGETDKANDYLKYYSTTRLLGDHVPYAIEAWPEGGQRHLSAESGLYCRIITEGMYGIRPTGFSSFDLTPHLPKAWDKMALRKVNIAGTVFDIEVVRKGEKLDVIVLVKGKRVMTKTIKNNTTLSVKL